MQPLARFQALVIGVGSYEHFTDLPETVNDATQLKRVLVDPQRCGYPSDRVQLLVERDATKDKILNGLAALAKETTSDTTTVVYFSGHGGFPKDDPTSVYLCPAEANVADLAKTALSNDVLSAALAQIKTRRLVVLIDACHASGAASFKGAEKGDASAEKAPGWISDVGNRLAQYQLREGSGRIIFSSSRREQASWTYPNGRMSLFTYYLIQGLGGQAPASEDGAIRVFDLFHYVSKQVQAKKRSQEPVLAAQDVTMNFPLALSRGGRKDDSQALPAQPQSELVMMQDTITRNASVGIRAFVLYLRSIPVELLDAVGTELAVIELKLNEFNEIEKQIRIFGETPQWKAERRMVILFFIQLSLDLRRILDE